MPTGSSYASPAIVRKLNRKKKKGELEMEQVRGQAVKVQTTADECVRLTIDIDTSLIPEDVNVLKWKNNMVFVQLIEGPGV